MILTVKLKPSQTHDMEEIDLEDLGYSDDEWKDLPTEKKDEIVTEYIGEKERPYWVIQPYYIE